MYLAVDIGGTKTFIAVLSDDGRIVDQRRFESNPDYHQFLVELEDNFKQLSSTEGLLAGCAGVPGTLDRKAGIAHDLGNLPWEEKSIGGDIAKICGTKMIIENDANLAALSEAMLNKEYQSVLYFTISTGIGTGLIRHQKIDPALIKSEGGHIVLPHDGQLKIWESFASGEAIYERLGKKASDITDEADWSTIAHSLSLGFFEHIAILQPDLIVVGGSVGAHFDHYGKHLIEDLHQYETPLVTIPPIIKAQRPEEAVIFGCYDLARQKFGDGPAN